MKPTPKITSPRDELAEEYWNRLNGPIGVTAHVTTIFKAGWDAAEARLKEDNRKLVEALEAIAAHEPTKGLIKAFPDRAVYDMNAIAKRVLREHESRQGECDA